MHAGRRRQGACPMRVAAPWRGWRPSRRGRAARCRRRSRCSRRACPARPSSPATRSSRSRATAACRPCRRRRASPAAWPTPALLPRSFGSPARRHATPSAAAAAACHPSAHAAASRQPPPRRRWRRMWRRRLTPWRREAAPAEARRCRRGAIGRGEGRGKAMELCERGHGAHACSSPLAAIRSLSNGPLRLPGGDWREAWRFPRSAVARAPSRSWAVKQLRVGTAAGVHSYGRRRRDST